MSEDIRLSVGFWSHPKTIKLQRRLGVEGVLALLRLWTWTGQSRPSGALTGMDAEDIEIAAGWQGEAQKLAAAFEELRWIDREGDDYSIHGWDEHQPWVSGEAARKRAASIAGKASAAKRANEKGQPVQHDVNDRSTDSNEPLKHVERTVKPLPNPSPCLSSPCLSKPEEKAKEKGAPPSSPRRDIDPEDPELPELPPFTSEREPMSPAERQERAMYAGLDGSGGFRDFSAFEAFWSVYPWQVGKRAAFMAWQAVEGQCRDVTPQRILTAIKAQVANGHHFDGLDGRPAIPAPKNWLEQGRWDDVVRGSPEDHAANPMAEMTLKQKLEMARVQG